MQRILVLVFCFLISVQACDDHDVCPVDLELEANGDLSVEYHAPDGDYYNKVIFKIFLANGKKLRRVDKTPEDHEGHEDWGVVFVKKTPFVACDSYRIRVISKTKGQRKLERDLTKQIPGPNCPEAAN